MEGIAPVLQFCLNLEIEIEMGHSVRAAILRINSADTSAFAERVSEVLLQFDSGCEKFNVDTPSRYQQFVLQLLWRGLSGEPILSALKILSAEIEKASVIELEAYLARLPLLSLLPLLFLIFPAFLILLFMPLLTALNQGLSQ